MNNEGTTKAPKDKNCPYCGQAFTSSSLGRHLDLYIKSKNPKAPDGVHDVDEIRKLRGSITRRQPRGGARRDNSDPRSSHAGSKRSPAASEVDSISARSPADTHVGADAVKSPASRRVFNNRQMIKSSLDAKQRFQDALDTAKASELALREMISSWRAAKQQISVNSMPFDFHPLSLDFPALCLQCLEPPPTLFSSTPHPTSTSWSISPPGEKQKEALSAFFQEEFRKWKASCAAATTAAVEELLCPPSQAAAQRENSAHVVQKAERAAEMLEKQVAEHLTSAFQVWKQLPAQRQHELWILQMARSISTKRDEVGTLKETQLSLRQEIANLTAQVDQLNRQQQPREFKIVPPMTMKVDKKIVELWTESNASGRRGIGANMEDHRSDLNAVVSGAIERWKSVILTARAASGMTTQRPLDESSVPLKTPTSAVHPMTPGVQQSTPHQQLHQGKHGQYQQSSPHAQSSIARNTSVSSGGPTASEPRTSVASTPIQSPMDSENDDDDDDDADGDDDADADADADVEMEGGNEYLSSANTSSHHTMTQLAQHPGSQVHQMHSITRSQDQHMAVTRHNPYPSRANSYGNPGLLPSQQVHMSQQAFGHQMQSLEHHLAQGHGNAGMGWNNQ